MSIMQIFLDYNSETESSLLFALQNTVSKFNDVIFSECDVITVHHNSYQSSVNSFAEKRSFGVWIEALLKNEVISPSSMQTYAMYMLSKPDCKDYRVIVEHILRDFIVWKQL